MDLRNRPSLDRATESSEVRWSSENLRSLIELRKSPKLDGATESLEAIQMLSCIMFLFDIFERLYNFMILQPNKYIF